jgi:hypothetical protein
MVCMKAMARASSTEAFKDALATIVRADEVVAMDAERTAGRVNPRPQVPCPRDHVSGWGTQSWTLVDDGATDRH